MTIELSTHILSENDALKLRAMMASDDVRATRHPSGSIIVRAGDAHRVFRSLDDLLLGLAR